MAENKKLYYVSKYAELTLTRIPEEVIVGEGGRERKQRAKRIMFNKCVMPRKLRGEGFLGRDAGGQSQGGDKNSNVFWGVFSTSDADEIAFLRNHEYYRRTAQDNKIHAEIMLKELDWDPMLLERGEGVRVSGGKSMSREEVEADAPVDHAPAKTAARVGLTAK